MSWSAAKGGRGVPADLIVLDAEEALLEDELPRIRATALAWRNGCGALLAGLIGFGLIKGRTDIGELAEPFSWLAGVLLGLALAVGAFSAVRLLRAAHGQPRATDAEALRRAIGSDPRTRGRHGEAIASADALTDGVYAAFACAALLCAAVAVTWYGPTKDSPSVQVQFQHGPPICATTAVPSKGKLQVRDNDGERVYDLSQVTALTPVDTCPGT